MQSFPKSLPQNLIEKYSTRVPRYTSYPTAPLWQEFTEAEKQNLKIQAGKDTALYIHIPFCSSQCRFCGCSSIVTRKTDIIEDYLQALILEMKLVVPSVKDAEINCVQLGGGSPSYLSPQQTLLLFSELRKHFNITKDCEIAIEIKPEHCSPQYMDALKEAGINRVSLGIQDFDPEVQKEIDRIQSYDVVKNIINDLRNNLGIHSINLDLIYGLPAQTEDSFKTTMEQILTLSPERIALFHYAHLPNMKAHQKLINETLLPDTQTRTRIFMNTLHTLLNKGYEFIGMDHFALPHDELAISARSKTMHRNFMGYTKHRNQSLIALGITGIGETSSLYYQNEKKLAEYLRNIKDRKSPVVKGFLLSDEDRLRKDVITTLMCSGELDIKDFEQRYSFDFQAHFEKELRELASFQKDELLSTDNHKIRVRPLGRFFIRNVCSVFDSYLNKTNTAFSKTL
jgi:oxygen-independent coproporphyrinogen-3 oxidase